MTKIKLNQTEFEVEGYNKNTYLTDGVITSNASCQLVTSDIATVNALFDSAITAIQIYYEDTLIYNLPNINARVESISEYLNGNRMGINVNLIFDTNV